MSGVVGAATVDLCADRACATLVGSATVDGGGAAATPDAELPAGPIFWRVRAGATTSATWEMFVGHGSAPVDTSWGATLDLDGDGVPDVAAGATSGVAVWPGGAGGLGRHADDAPQPRRRRVQVRLRHRRRRRSRRRRLRRARRRRVRLVRRQRAHLLRRAERPRPHAGAERARRRYRLRLPARRRRRCRRRRLRRPGDRAHRRGLRRRALHLPRRPRRAAGDGDAHRLARLQAVAPRLLARRRRRSRR